MEEVAQENDSVSDGGISNQIRDRQVTEMVIDLEEEEEQRQLKRKRDEISRRPVPNHGNLRSNVYTHFDWSDTLRKWKCKHCPHSYNHAARGGSASLSNHLKSAHPSLINQDITVENILQRGMVLTSHFNKVDKPKPLEPITEEGFKQRLLAFIISTDQPFSVVEEPSFIRLLGYSCKQNTKCDLPCQVTIRNWIREAYDTEKAKLKQVLSGNGGQISFILDGWTSSNQKAFQGVIACWINNDWKLCHSAIDLTILKGEHSGDNMSAAFEAVLDDYGLWNKLLAVTTDNAGNMNTMFKKLDEAAIKNMIDFSSIENRVRCLANIVNLACKAIITNVLGVKGQSNSDELSDADSDLDTDEEESISNPVTQCFLTTLRKTISKIRASPQRRELFEKQCMKFNLKHKSLVLDVDTRWNSTLAMLQRAMELKEPFLATSKLVKSLNRFNLGDEGTWKKVEKMISVLKPFEEATKLISQGHSPTISDTESVYQYLFKHLEKYTEETERKVLSTRSKTQSAEQVDSWLKTAATAGLKKLTKYYASSEALVYVVATVMDPRYKLSWFQVSWKRQYAEKVKSKLFQLWNDKYKDNHSADEEICDENPSTSCEIKNLVSEKMRKYQKQDDELKRYLLEPVSNPAHLATGITGALTWWKSHEVDYPRLSKMAKDFLAISATGVPVERLFSTGPDLLTARRQRLNADTIQQCICLKQWMKAEESSYKFEHFKEALKEKLGLEV